MRKTLIAILLAFTVSLGLSIPATATETFSDVPANAWYASDIQDVQKYGIIEGVGNSRFLPEGNLTYAQAVTMTARTYAYIHHETIPEVSSILWYDKYVAYAEANDLVSNLLMGLPDNMNEICSRYDMAVMFYEVIKNENNLLLNKVEKIPVLDYTVDNTAIFSLYRFGILTGSDSYGSFYPYRNITRAETAAILNRLLDQNKRKSFELLPDFDMRYLDYSRAYTYETYFYDTVYDFTVAFYTDGKLFGYFCIPESGYFVSVRGTYTCDGNKLVLNYYGNDYISHAVSYEVLHVLDCDFAVKQTSYEGLFSSDFKGKEIRFLGYDDLAANQCKNKCIEFWDFEPQ